MIKITIDGEEVYSAKDFTIKEEMLNTPSVILNNVYPISWEQDRDYVSRFYHPNDYSKCLIMNNTHIPEEPGITVTSTSINANVDTSKKYEYALMGDTSQSLPSGYTRVDYIQSSGTQYIDTGLKLTQNYKVEMQIKDIPSVSSKIFGSRSSATSNNYSILTGTVSGNASLVADFQNYNNNRLSVNIASSSSDKYIVSISNSELRINTSSKNVTTYSNFTTPGNAYIFNASGTYPAGYVNASTKLYYCRMWNGTALVRNFIPCKNSSNVVGLYDLVTNTFYQNAGTGTFSYGSVVPTPSEPVAIDNVTGEQVVNVLGKNLWKFEGRENGGITSTYNAQTGEIKFSGTCTASNGWVGISTQIPINIPSGQYCVSINSQKSYNVSIRMYYDSSNYSGKSINAGNLSNTLTTTKDTIKIQLWLQLTYNQAYDDTLYLQLEKGNQATSFEPYREQSYSINLGKNLFDKDTITEITGTVQNGFFRGGGANKAVVIPCKPNTTYTVQKRNDGDTNRFAVASSESIPSSTSDVDTPLLNNLRSDTSTSITLITGMTAQYLVIQYYRTAEATITKQQLLDSIQVEEGSQATSYTPYITPTELNAIEEYKDFIRKGTGKNLFEDEYIKTTGNTTDINATLTKGTYTLSLSNGSNFGGNVYIQLYNENTMITESGHISSETSSNFSSSSYWYYFGTTNINTLTFTIDDNYNAKIALAGATGTQKAQVEKGSENTLYEPYGYKDKWYMYKAVGKVEYTGITVQTNNVQTNFCQFLTPVIDDILPNIANTESSADYLKSNYFKLFGGTTSSKKIRFNVPHSEIGTTSSSTNAQAKSALETAMNGKNIVFYYPLNTPVITDILDEELINQLESVELYNGTNNIIVSGYLPSPIQLHYNYVIEEDISDLLFCGVVKNSGYISLNPRHPHYQTLQILDFKTFLSEGETLDFVIANKTIEEAIEQVISTIEPYGFIKGNIQLLNSSDVIGAYSTKDKTAYDVFNYIADITQSRWTTRLIDENTVAIDFYDPTLLPQGSPINYTQNYFEQNLIDDISYSYGSNDYRNKQVMTSSEVYGNILQTQTIVANGYQTQFDTELKIGKISSITINGVQMTFATTQEKELGYSADFYYTPGNNFFESADLRSTGQIIIISYLAIVEGRQIITNALEIDRVSTSTGRKGVVARYEDRNDATTSTELQLIGQSYIKYKGVPEIKLSVTTRKNLWNIGDRVTFNAPITELATEYMVKKKEIQRVFANPSSEEVIFYKFELSSSFNMEQAINYFDNQRAKAKGNIGEGEYITRNVDIENISNVIFYDGTCEEITLVGDNTLNSILNSPFVN